MLSGITILCFAASYGATLLLEISRLFFRAPVRLLVMAAFTAGGLFAHSTFLWYQAQREVGIAIAPWSSWFDWCLLASWVVAAAYFAMFISRPKNTLGIFMLPIVLAFIALAAGFRDLPSFDRDRAYQYWLWFHATALLVGTVAVTLGFVAGVMYLVGAYRLKHKLPPRPGFKLPSLEWLQNLNRRSLLLSTSLLAAGLVSGIVLNLIKRASASGGVPWTDPVVWSSGILFAWLAAAMIFEFLYKPARQGRKVAYLTLASMGFLVLALTFVLMGRHGAPRPEPRTMGGSPVADPIESSLRSPPMVLGTAAEGATR